MIDAWGKTTEGMLAAFAESVSQSRMRKPRWVKAYCHMVPLIKTGNKLKQREQGQLSAWLENQGLGSLSAADVLTIQISYKELARLFNGNETAAKQAIFGCIERGLIELVSKGTKHHSSLYAIPLEQSIGTQLERKGMHLSNGRWVHSSSEIGTQFEAVEYTHHAGNCVASPLNPQSSPLIGEGESFDEFSIYE